MTDFQDGIKKEVAELKFLIHDLRVERFINEVIHFHVTLNTDLEIHGVNQAQVLHGEDLQELKMKAVSLRTAFRNYANAVRNYSPDKTVLVTGNAYIEAILDMCGLIMNPLWGRIDQVLSFLPEECRSVRSRSHYRNCLRWIGGVRSRIEHFFSEKESRDVYEEFDIANDIQEFTRNVIYGYVMEKSSARVELQLERLDPVIIGGNRQRFRRMFFNLVMNAVDAMGSKKVGAVRISDSVEGDHVVLRVSDNGRGMTAEKIHQLLTDKKTLDGELHSLGFVFVRQTVAEFQGELNIESNPEKGTKMMISLPFLRKAETAVDPGPEMADLKVAPERGSGPLPPGTKKQLLVEKNLAQMIPAAGSGKAYGAVVFADYQRSEAEFPGSIFALGVSADGKVDFFAHRPYERFWNITHEDLSPMFFEATLRGRLEEDEEKKPVLILKAPQNIREYFEFRSVDESGRSQETFLKMVHDEYVKVARVLIETGLSGEMGVHITGLAKFFGSCKELAQMEPFPLQLLAKQQLSTED